MDMDMDVSTILEDDPIVRFLSHKLAVAKTKTADFEEMIKKRRNIFDAALEDGHASDKCLRVTRSWRCIVNEKHVFGMDLTNTSDLPVKHPKVFLINANYPLTYTVRIYVAKNSSNSKARLEKRRKLSELCALWENDPTSSGDVTVSSPAAFDWSETNEITGTAILIIVVNEMPSFKKTDHKIDALLKFELPNGSFDQIKLPELHLSVSAIFDGDISSFDTLLATLSASLRTKFVVSFASYGQKTLRTALDGEDFFKKINPECTGLFYTISRLQGNILQLEEDDDGLEKLTIFTRNEQSVFVLLHCIYARFDGILIIPYAFKSNLLRLMNTTGRNKHEKLRQLQLCLADETRLVERFLKSGAKQDDPNGEELLVKDAEGYKNFRLTLSDLELKTDLCLNELQSEDRNECEGMDDT